MIFKRYIEKLNTWMNDSDFDDVRQIQGLELKDREIYCITNTPINDGLYIQGGATHTVFGMEYGNFEYGSQISFGYNGIRHRAKSRGVWSPWQSLTQKITTGKEFETGRIIDGKIEYGKRIDCGNLPNNSVKMVAHGLSNVTFTRQIEGIAVSGTTTSNTTLLPLPYVRFARNCIKFYFCRLNREQH